MTGAAAVRAYTALYAPTADELWRALPEIADALQAQTHELHARPSAERAELLARNLDGARRACLHYREALLREGTGGER